MLQLDLIRKCQANNRKAQLHLYRKYCGGMFIVASRYLINEDDAEDAVQEAFIKAFQNLEQFSGEVTFGAWLKRIVINQCLDVLKSRNQDFVEIEENNLSEEPNWDWKVDENCTVGQVKDAINNLPDKYRFVTMMYLLEGYDHGEISEVLQITESACRTRLMRGKGYLQKVLKEKKYVTGY